MPPGLNLNAVTGIDQYHCEVGGGRRIFDDGGLTTTRIIVSGDLDEQRIAGLVPADAPIDGFGVGTAISAVRDAPAQASGRRRGSCRLLR